MFTKMTETSSLGIDTAVDRVTSSGQEMNRSQKVVSLKQTPLKIKGPLPVYMCHNVFGKHQIVTRLERVNMGPSHRDPYWKCSLAHHAKQVKQTYLIFHFTGKQVKQANQSYTLLVT